MEDINNPVIVNVCSSLADLVAARGADGDLFGY